MSKLTTLFFSLTVAALLVVSACTNKTKDAAEQESATTTEDSVKGEKPMEKQTPSAEKGKNSKAVIKTTLGDIELTFYADVAPKHVENFFKLATTEFYNGTTFHRVVPGFVVQGGDPNSKDDDRSNDGQGGPGYTIEAEFNSKPHKRGTLSMARRADPNSAGSQFFICLAPQPSLDNKYTVFGEVTKGMDVVDKIAKAQTDSRQNPKEKIVMKSITIESN